MAIRLPGFRERRIRQQAAYWRAEMLEPPSPALRAKFEAWLASDPAHAAAYGELEPIVALSRQLPAPERRWRWQSAGHGLRPAFGAALVAAIAATGVLLVKGREQSAVYAPVTNPGPAIRLFQLSDGSRITLDAGASLGVAIDETARNVRLHSGRARFSVTSAPERPFTVFSDRARVTAEGGEFDVAVDNAGMTVVPLRGEVRVSRAPGSEEKTVPVAPGAAVRVDSAAVAPTRVSRGDRLWPVSRLSFDGTPLEKIVAMANRLGQPPIRLGSEGTGKLEVTAVLDLRNNRALGRKLAAALKLELEEKDGAVVLTR